VKRETAKREAGSAIIMKIMERAQQKVVDPAKINNLSLCRRGSQSCWKTFPAEISVLGSLSIYQKFDHQREKNQ